MNAEPIERVFLLDAVRGEIAAEKTRHEAAMEAERAQHEATMQKLAEIERLAGDLGAPALAPVAPLELAPPPAEAESEFESELDVGPPSRCECASADDSSDGCPEHGIVDDVPDDDDDDDDAEDLDAVLEREDAAREAQLDQEPEPTAPEPEPEAPTPNQTPQLSSAQQRAAEARSLVMQRLSQAGEAGTTQSALAAEPLNKSRAQTALQALEREGKAVRTGEARRAFGQRAGRPSPVWRAKQLSGDARRKAADLGSGNGVRATAVAALQARIGKVLWEDGRLSNSELQEKLNVTEVAPKMMLADALNGLINRGEVRRLQREDRKGFDYEVVES